MDPRQLHTARLVAQRLAGPAASDVVEAVRESLCVQSQDAALAYDSVARRAGATAAEARAAIDSGAVVRTHILRPTWHFVAAEDLRWVLKLTSPKVLSGLAARHRALGLAEPATRARLVDAVAAEVSGGPRTRTDLADALTASGMLARGELFWSQLTHLTLIAELEGIICSGPTREGGLNGHSYVLVDTWVPRSRERGREEAVTELVERFCASHGPVAIRDLQRWTRLTVREIRAAMAGLGDAVASVEVDGQELWFGARTWDERGPGTAAFAAAPERAEGAWLLSTFDEAILTHSVLRLPIPMDAPHAGQAPNYAEAGGGVAVWDLAHVGTWKRTQSPRRGARGEGQRGAFRVRITVGPGLPAEARAALTAEAEDLAHRAGVPGAIVDWE